VLNLGTRPTIDEGSTERVLELHLLDFQGEIYDRNVEVTFARSFAAKRNSRRSICSSTKLGKTSRRRARFSPRSRFCPSEPPRAALIDRTFRRP